MLLGRSNKNDYGSQTQQIIWKGLGATSAGLELNSSQFPRAPLPGVSPRYTPAPGHAAGRSSSLRRGHERCQGRSSHRILRGVLPSDYTPPNNGLGGWSGQEVFPVGKKKKNKIKGLCGHCAQFCSFQELQPGRRHWDTRGKHWPWGFTC